MGRKNESLMLVVLILLSFFSSIAADNEDGEIITVTQHTKAQRAKREDDHDEQRNGILHARDFPRYMDFTLHLKDQDLKLILEKYMHPYDIRTTDINGDIKFHPQDPRKQYAAYQDKLSRASVIVKCTDSLSACTLDGSFHKDGDKFRLHPVEGDQGKHKILNVSSYFDQDTVVGVDPKDPTLPNEQDLRKAFDEIYENYARQNQGKEQFTEDPTLPSASASHVIKKRQVTTSCNIAEIQAVADFSVWNFFVEKTFNESEAEATLEEHYIALFSDVDLRYKCLEDQNGICFRVYLTDIRIEKTQAESWSNTFTPEGRVNMFQGLLNCPNRIAFAPSTDLTVCFTRLYTDFQGDTVGRVFQFNGVLCDPTFQNFRAMVSVDRHDDQAVHVASAMLGTMNVDTDGVAGCNDSLQFIGSQVNLVPTIPGTELNPWRFSNCSLEGIQARIDFLNTNNFNCLLSGSISEEDLDALVDSRELPGKIFDLDYQCQLAFDVNSSACIGPNETSIYDVEDICVAGVYCFVNETCENRTRVYTGSPCGCKEQCIKNQCLREFNTSLGEPCNGECECFDPNSVCDNDTHLCVCLDGFYDSNGGEENGTCLPLIPTGDNCSVADSCLDENADCNFTSGICECNDGFFDLGNGTCVAFQILCGECVFDAQCELVNASCVFGECKCLTDQYTDECGICQIKLPLGANCSGEEMCLDERSFCNPVLGECECVDGTYDSNGDEPGGDCLDLIETGDNCTIPGSCKDSHAECDDSVGTCECIDGFFVSKNGTCVTSADLCDACSSDEECSSVGATCVNGSCECASDQYTDECGICYLKLPLGANCSGEEICLDERSCCNPVLGECECVDGTYDSNGDTLGGVCLDLIENGDNCTLPGSCEDENAECNNSTGTCECVDGYFLSLKNTCLEYKNLCDPCKFDEQCSLVGATCVEGLCECLSDEYTDECGICNKKLPLGANCSGEEMCLDEGSCCNPVLGECDCVDGTYDSNGGMPGGVCLYLIDNGDNCTLPGSCEDPNAECNDSTGTCECVYGYFLFSNNTCLKYENLCDPCDYDIECSLVGATCIEGYCECLSDQYTDECGICNGKLPLGANCSGEEMCLDERSCCNPVLGECECVDGTYDSNGDKPGGVCLYLIENGDNCTLIGSCEDPNAECDDYSGTCECVDGYFLFSNDTCLEYKNLCDTCDFDIECWLVGATCVEGLCECSSKQYTDECGICKNKLPLGANCSGEEMCLNERSCCNPVLGECECVDGTYDSNGDKPGGVCLYLIENGDNCTLIGSCEDPNAECDDYSGTCECVDGYFLFSNDTCLEYKNLCDPCYLDVECSLFGATCVEGLCECLSDQYTDECGVCNTKLPLGANCSGEEMCLDERSCCNPVLGECECVDGTYDSNGGEPGGVCLYLIENGDNCTLIGSCEDPNAECDDYSGTCECVDGYFLFSNDTCLEYKNLCDTCDFDIECWLVGATCVEGLCECSTKQYTDECGICKIKLPLGANCSGEEMCLDERSSCNPVLGECECVDGTYDSNGDEPGGVCLDLIETGDNCTLLGSCDDPHAECDDSTGTCECIDGFFLVTNGTCLAYKDLCEECSFDEECSLVQATCVLGFCECASYQYTDECGICRKRLPIGANCSGEEMCLDDRSVCNPVLGACECVDGTYDSNGDMPGGVCLDLIPTGGNCSIEGSCEDCDAECNFDSNACECVEGFFELENGTCLEYRYLSETCVFDEECALVQGFCDEGVCKCFEWDYADQHGICRPRLLLGANCSEDTPCADQFAVCSPFSNVCECMPPAFENVKGKCQLPSIPNGDECFEPESCEDENAVCSNESLTCECAPGFFLLPGNNTCLPYKNLCEDCSVDLECEQVNATCVMGRCECSDSQYTDVCGICKMSLGLGENCTADTKCLDDSAFCDPIDGVCECVPGTFESIKTGMCEDTLPNGGKCFQEGSCEDPNAECNLESKTCECLDKFFLFGEESICLPYKDLCDTCSYEEECDYVNATCIEGQCLCTTSQYVSRCGICEMRVGLGENCTDDTQCLDDNAYCDSNEGVCTCEPGTFASEALVICEDAIPNGGNCSQDGSCADPNAECDLDSKTCECVYGFFLLPGNDTCLPYKNLCEDCSVDLECEQVNATCVMGICECSENQYTDVCGICKMSLALGEKCSADAKCLDDNAFCDPIDGVCECVPGTFESETTGMCEDDIPNGGNCSQDGSCADPHADCNLDSTTCECVDGFFLFKQNNTCLPFKDLCDSCSFEEECGSVNAICMEGQCLCTTSQYVSRCGICEMRVGLGENCTDDTQCLDDNAYCDSNEGVCTCEPGTFASEALVICEDAIPNGGNCTQDGSCADPYAECDLDSKTCECVDGFFLLPGNNTCLPYKNLCEDCSIDLECEQVNATCVMGRCECSDSQYTDVCGICKMSLALGEDCSADTKCLDDSAFCDLIDGVCECVPGTFESDKTGMCEDSIPNGGKCWQVGSCEDPEAECDLDSKTCECVDGFFLLLGNNTCLPYKDLCDSCSLQEECDYVNATCMMGQCLCAASQYVSRCGICKMRLALGENCTDDTECLDDNAYCDSNEGVCTCEPGTFASESTGMCEDDIPNGGNCMPTDACADSNAECNVNTTTCECVDGYFLLPGNNTCLPYKTLCDSCSFELECYEVNATCMGGQCLCSDSQYVSRCGICKMRLALGEECTDDTECLDDKAYCDSIEGVCTCEPGTFASDSTGMCEDEITNGGACSQLGSCADANAECDLGAEKCQCLDGFFLLAVNNTCLPYKNLCEDCSIHQECDNVNATCVENTCKCASDQYVSRCGVCQMKLALAENCSTDTVCLDDNAACDPDTGTCCCLPGFFDSDGVCVYMPDLGENCTSTNECFDCNAICQSSVCVCGSDFVEDDGVCVPATTCMSTLMLMSRQLGDSCNSDCDCIGPNVVCDNSVCSCSAETVLNEAGDGCAVPNGLACVGDTTASNCLDPNAVCSSDETLCESFCVCKDGYYLPTHESQCKGTCQPKPIAGESCTPTTNLCDDICFNSTCRVDTCAGDVALGDICQFTYSCAEYPHVKCVSYADLGVTPTAGRSSSDKICVCNVDEGYYQVDEFCFNN